MIKMPLDEQKVSLEDWPDGSVSIDTYYQNGGRMFDPWHPPGGRRELMTSGCPLTPTLLLPPTSQIE